MDHDSPHSMHFTSHTQTSNSGSVTHININSTSTSTTRTRTRSRSIFSSLGSLRSRPSSHPPAQQPSPGHGSTSRATEQPASPAQNARSMRESRRRSRFSPSAIGARISQFGSSLLSSIRPDRRDNLPAPASSEPVANPRLIASNTTSTDPIYLNTWSDVSTENELPVRRSSSSLSLVRSESPSPNDFSRSEDPSPPQSTWPRRSESNNTEDQATILAQLLAIAATATAISLVDNSRLIDSNLTGHTILGSPSSSGNGATNENETTFTGFLSSLRTGLLASELSSSFNNDSSTSNNSTTGDDESPPNRPVNFFRMFRFPPSPSEPNQVPILMVGVRPVENRSSSPAQAPFSSLGGSQTGSRRDLFMRDEDSEVDDIDADSIIFRNTALHDSPSTRNNDGNNQESPRQSWVIFVLGGTYPMDHPVLLAPSLFSDNPSYEDLITLESFMGQVKPPVATAADVERSGGLYTVGSSSELEPPIGEDSRCLICLSNYVSGDECRKLNDCCHSFHQECIDQWLLRGRNSCPLCRREGVKHAAEEDAPTAATTAPTTVTDLPNMTSL